MDDDVFAGEIVPIGNRPRYPIALLALFMKGWWVVCYGPSRSERYEVRDR